MSMEKLLSFRYVCNICEKVEVVAYRYDYESALLPEGEHLPDDWMKICTGKWVTAHYCHTCAEAILKLIEKYRNYQT